MRWLVPLLLVACSDPLTEAEAPIGRERPAADASSAIAAPPVSGAPASSAAGTPLPGPAAASGPPRFDRVASAAPAPGPAPAGGFALAAHSCMDDSSCDLAHHASLLLAAVDAGEEVRCHLLLQGIGVPVDLSRARSCFEAAVVRERAWQGSSPSLDRLQLGLMRARGLGGRRDIAGARAVMLGAFEDGSFHELRAHIEAEAQGKPKKTDQGAEVIDACYALAMTTLAMNQCAARDLDDLELRGRSVAKALHVKHGADGVAAFDRMWKSCDAFAAANGELAGDMYRGGTMSTMVHLGAQEGALSSRMQRVEQALRGEPITGAPEQRAAPTLAAALRAARSVDAEHSKLLDAAEAARSSCRANELTLLTALGATPGAKQLATMLDQERALELTDEER